MATRNEGDSEVERRLLKLEHTIEGNGSEGLKVKVSNMEILLTQVTNSQEEERRYRMQDRLGMKAALRTSGLSLAVIIICALATLIGIGVQYTLFKNITTLIKSDVAITGKVAN